MDVDHQRARASRGEDDWGGNGKIAGATMPVGYTLISLPSRSRATRRPSDRKLALNGADHEDQLYGDGDE